MSIPAATHAVPPVSARPKSRAVTVLIRVPLIALSVVLTLIAFRYLFNPVQAASEAGIAFTSTGGVTVARVGFGAFPLAFAALFLSSLLSRRRILPGLGAELALLAIVMAVRILGMAAVRSAETAMLLVPEAVMAALCILAIRLESNRQRSERPDAA